MLDIVVTLIGLWRLFEELFRKTSFFHSMTSITVMTCFAFFARHDTSSIYIIYVQVLIALLICLATYRNGKINALFSSTYLLLLFILVGTNYVSLTSTQVGDISSPLKHGDFYIVQGGNNPLLNAHRFSNAPAQRYALDISKVSSFGKRTVSFFGTTSLSDYLIFNEPVFAPCDGVVTQTNDQFENMPIGDQDEQNPAGNFIAIACAENFTVVLAHLQRPLDVVAGQSIVIGERIGLVGNSGNSTEPHLHVHAVSGKPARIGEVLFTGEGIKLTVDGKTLIKNSMLSTK